MAVALNALSSQRPRTKAARLPSVLPSVNPRQAAAMAKMKVLPSTADILDDRPPRGDGAAEVSCTTRVSHSQYWTGSGLSNPICCLTICTTSCGASGGNMALIGSPGPDASARRR